MGLRKVKAYRVTMQVGMAEPDDDTAIYWEPAGDYKVVIGLTGLVCDEEMIAALRAAFDEGRHVWLRAEGEEEG
ncbi:hypothetical protein MYX64_06465 [Nitrospinae bacterium AH_259_B05_G02_I21]|nr:hypothetical protein [Nitrospinae bacterium AH_259_B05_G02_I21]